ncbi:MAG TPA: DMT family transporter [Candidatus Avidesulfovibrio excrementigallinarum]|nr:DMT family transporter [Candidatus Avidesulfovibrio excrementigallinarum]
MGFVLALLSSALFGLIPLFTLPMLHHGMTAESILFYRFLFSSVVLAPILVARRERIAATRSEFIRLMGMSLFYSLAALFLFQAYNYLASGVASTIQFLYPLLVVIIMVLVFHEKLRWSTVAACLLALLGVALLSGALQPGQEFNVIGVSLAFASALTCGLYIILIHVARLTNMSGLVITFYLLLIGTVYALIFAVSLDRFCWLPSWSDAGLAAMLAIVTAVMSNLLLVWAIRLVGSTQVAVLGAMEPLTAMLVGVLVFSEPFDLSVASGVGLILCAVTLVMVGPRLFHRRHADR